MIIIVKCKVKKTGNSALCAIIFSLWRSIPPSKPPPPPGMDGVFVVVVVFDPEEATVTADALGVLVALCQ